MERITWILAAWMVIGCNPGDAAKEAAVDSGIADGHVDTSSPCTTLLTSKPATLITSSGSVRTPAIAASASGFGVAWMDGRKGWALYFASVSAAGQASVERAVTSVFATSSMDLADPQIASDGVEYALSSGSSVAGSSVALVDSNGVVRKQLSLPADTLPTTLAYSASRRSYAVGFLLQDWARYKTNAPRPYLALLDPQSAKLGSSVELSADGSDGLALLPLGDGFGVFADHELSYGNTEVYWQITDGVAPPSGKGTRLTDLPNKAIYPRAAAGGGGRSGLVWAEWTMAIGGGRTAYWLQTDSGGKLLGPTRLADGGNPSVAWNGREYVVAWATTQTLVIARVDPSSGQIVGTPTTISEVPFGAMGAIAWSGSHGAVVWEAADNTSIIWVGLRCE
jgi:hypothetical protein